MANSYYNNALEDGDTFSGADLEEIEAGFTLVEAAIGGKAAKAAVPVEGHLLAMDASGDGVDSGVSASGGSLTVPATATVEDLAVVDAVISAVVGFSAIIDNGNSGTSKTIAWTSGNKQKITATGNCTITFTAPPVPTSLSLIITQDATGSRVFTWPAAVKWVGGSAMALSTAASAKDVITFLYDGTNYLAVGLPGFA